MDWIWGFVLDFLWFAGMLAGNLLLLCLGVFLLGSIIVIIISFIGILYYCAVELSIINFLYKIKNKIIDKRKK